MPKFSEIKPEHRPYGTAADDDKGTEFVASIHTDQTGGMCMVDIVVLRSGQVLTVNDECVMAWPSLQAWYDSATDDSATLGIIDLSHLTEVDNADV